MKELCKRFADAGTTFEQRPDGMVAVTDWPKPRVSNPSFLSDLSAEWQKEQEDKIRMELSIILDAIELAPWREQEGERIKRIAFVSSAIERIRALLGR